MRNFPRRNIGMHAPGKALVAVALPMISESEIAFVQGVRQAIGGLVEVAVLSGGYEGPLGKLAKTGRLAGAIGEFAGSAWLEALAAQGVAVVQIGAVGDPDVPTVAPDLEALGEEAASLFAGTGVKSAAYLGPAGPPGSVMLGEAFAAACDRKGLQNTASHAFSGPLVRSFVSALPIPSGLLCASDHLARLAIRCAAEADLRVPLDLGVVGVGNSRVESLQAGLGISSFELPHGEMGRRAGEFMAGLLQGREPMRKSLLLVSPRFHPRETCRSASGGIARALAWLRNHPDTAVTAGELARIAGMSRRSFEMAVQGARGCSPGRLLMETRRDRAEKLLRETNLAVAAVGRECGYPEPSVFSTAFRRWTGKSPRSFRLEARRQKGLPNPEGSAG
jgi:AraC-like DNA-binding protein